MQSPKVTVDPMLTAEEAQAQTSLVGSLQTQTQGDMASLMARYGTQLAMSGSTMSPLAVSSTPTSVRPAVRA